MWMKFGNKEAKATEILLKIENHQKQEEEELAREQDKLSEHD
jgi:hypothetical protein